MSIWIDRLQGAVLAAAAVLRLRLAPPPPTVGIAERLAMLPTAGAPLEQSVTIRWNNHLVPYIDAANAHDLATALGIVHAHLRLGQIETMRRVAAGRVAEMIGPLGIEIDRTILLMEIDRAVPAIIAGLPARTRLWCEAFLRGFNHHLLHSATLPLDCEALGIGREPWSLTDLFRLARLCCADVTWLLWSRMLRARRRLGPAAWRSLWPELCGAEAPLLPGPVEALLARTLRAGSNSWAIAAQRSESGAAQLASDPHLSLALPNQWLLAGLHARDGEGLNAVGMMLPGLPFIALGRNRHLAWGGTSLHAASSELLDLSHVLPGSCTTRHATIRVRWSRPRRLALRISPYGPVVSDGLLLRTRGPLAMRWIGHGASDEMTAMLDVIRARNGAEFRAALAGFAVPGQTMVYAASDGSVGRVIAAHLPQRPEALPADIVAPPAASAGFTTPLTGAALPAEIDPPEGFVASANERPPPGPVPIGFFFAPPDRAARLRSLLAAPGRLGRAAMGQMQADTMSHAALALRDAWRKLLPAGSGPAQQALLDWDGRYDHDSAGALVFEAVLAKAQRVVLPRRRRQALGLVWTGRASLAAELLAQPPERLRAGLAAGLVVAERMLRRHRNWGGVHRAAPGHLLAALPLLRRRFSAAEFAIAGGNDTLNKAASPPLTGRHRVSFGSCARHRCDLADPDANEFVLLGGQDGWIGSVCATDQIALWQRGETITVPLQPQTAAARFGHITELRP